jgi:hypothetical protein
LNFGFNLLTEISAKLKLPLFIDSMASFGRIELSVKIEPRPDGQPGQKPKLATFVALLISSLMSYGEYNWSPPKKNTLWRINKSIKSSSAV